MSRIGKLFSSLTRRSAEAPSVNREGYPAWERPLEEQYLQTLLTNTFGNTFYVKQKELVAEAALIHDQMVARDPRFAATALVYARNRGFMRSQPVFGLAKLASVKEPHLEAAFGDVLLTPNDLADFTVGGEAAARVRRWTPSQAARGPLAHRAHERVLGHQVRRLARRWVLAARSVPCVSPEGGRAPSAH